MLLNSFDEWSPLKEVVVGNPAPYTRHDIDLSFILVFCEMTHHRNPAIHKVKKRYVDELREDVDGLVETLEDLGIRVHRPTDLKRETKFKTPYWQSTGGPALNVRDRALILGDEIIETAPLIRARYFENDLLKPIFYNYFKAGARWTNMPMPMMTDHSFDLSYVNDVDQDMHGTEASLQQTPSPFDVGYEMMIDAAQCLRFGEDVVVNVAVENHELGLQWMERHLGDRFRLHRMYRLTDNHIDSFFMPLKPGKLLVRSPKVRDALPAPLQKWDLISPPEPTEHLFPTYEDDDLVLTSRYIDLNVLSIDEERVIVNSLNPELIRTLEKEGFTPIPVRHRHRRIFGGGFHCLTLDTVREGTKQKYFD